jgi:hypothetical protein
VDKQCCRNNAVQAAMFHLPRLLWKHSEGGLMKMLVGNLTDPMMIINVSLLSGTFDHLSNAERREADPDRIHQEVFP